jgi:trans-aconitate methyltransferase
MPDPGDPDELVAEPLEQDGTFLDVGCANGALMETVHDRTGRRGVHIEPYGLEPVPELAELARRRLPTWADRIWTGDPLDWTPPQRFDTVRVGLDGVPPDGHERLLTRVLQDVVAPGGHLLVGPFAEDPGSYGTVERVRGWGLAVRRMLEVADGETVHRLLVLDGPTPTATVTSLEEHRRRRSG